eukprot:SM000027S09612  [mRNA]  locus=s27:337246:341585:+ [translate_table: standard]
MKGRAEAGRQRASAKHGRAQDGGGAAVAVLGKAAKGSGKPAAVDAAAAAAAAAAGKAIFAGVHALFVEEGVPPVRLQVWKRRLEQLGGVAEHHMVRRVTHVLAASWKHVESRLGSERARKLKAVAAAYSWLEDSLTRGERLPAEQYRLAGAPEGAGEQSSDSSFVFSQDTQPLSASLTGTSIASPPSALSKRRRSEGAGDKDQEHWLRAIHDGAQYGAVHGRSGSKEKARLRAAAAEDAEDGGREETGEGGGVLSAARGEGEEDDEAGSDTGSGVSSGSRSSGHKHTGATVSQSDTSALVYVLPDLNAHITGPFKELQSIYSDALGDDRRYFSYYKALSVLEKLPFKITSADQVKGLPAIGKSLQDHVREILATGKLQKLENYKTDEKVVAVQRFGSVWGIGPVTARRLYDMGYRTLEELAHEPSLMPAQRVEVMEKLVQDVAQEIQPGISVLCGGSYRRGKATVGDMDMVVTHPDGRSHRGFLPTLVKVLKDRDFVTEDLMVGPVNSLDEHSSGVDTYLGLCKYPGREQRHRIDFKVYPTEQYAFGLIAWTGNDVLNRRLRILAEFKGYKLDDHGLFPAARDNHHHTVAAAPRGVELLTEREVFEYLGFPWLEPAERNL